MIAFVCLNRPLSYNAKNKAAYQVNIRNACVAAHGGAPYEGALYGIVYYLKNTAYDLDADNLSKPVWDALAGTAYADDAAIRLRQAGIIDMRETSLDTLDLSSVPDAVADSLIEFAGTEDHVIYVELGTLDGTMYDFGLS